MSKPRTMNAMKQYILSILAGIFICMSQAASSDFKQVIILLGPPGSGKGTQAVRLSQSLNLPHISTGDIFRYNIKNATPLGLKVKEFMDAGKLVPDSVTLDMLFDRLEKPDCQNGFLLDGVPRTVAQAQALETYLSKHPHKLFVCNLVVSDAEVLKRITGRRSCPQCNSIYHIDSKPPKKEDLCDKCNTLLIQRTDDTSEVVQERLKAYYSQTKPVEDFYKGTSSVINIDGEQDQEQVFNALLTAIRS